MKQSKNHGTFNQQPQPLYTLLLAYYFEINQLFRSDPIVSIAFKVRFSFEEALNPTCVISE
jgi:hypothetical protein